MKVLQSLLVPKQKISTVLKWETRVYGAFSYPQKPEFLSS